MKLKHHLLFAFLVALIGALLWHSDLNSISFPLANAQTEGSFTVYPMNDTSTVEYYPDTQIWYNYTTIQIGYDYINTFSRWGWFKFDVPSQTFRGNITITEAYLHFYAYNLDIGNETTFYYAYSIDPTNETAWNEQNITWNNQPTLLGNDEGYTSGGVLADKQWYDLEVENHSESWRGIKALQDAYDNNRTKTYVFRTLVISRDFIMAWRTIDEINYPRLEIYYTLEEESTEETGEPVLVNPESYELLFYVDNDSWVTSNSPNTNYGSVDTSQIKYSATDGITSDVFLLFNLSYPDLIDGAENDDDLSLTDLAFDITHIWFYQYCYGYPDFGYFEDEGWMDWRPYNTLAGIDRANENWNETEITWNTKPSFRSDNVSLSQGIDDIGWFRYSLIYEENFIRYSVNSGNGSYTLVHRVDQDIDQYGYSDWRMKEYGSPYIPYIVMRVLVAQGILDLTLPTRLTFFNAHEYLARSWSLTPFIAGHLLCAMLYSVIVIPINWITKKLLITTMSVLGMSILFLTFGWLHIGAFVFIFILTVITQGVKIKRWLS